MRAESVRVGNSELTFLHATLEGAELAATARDPAQPFTPVLVTYAGSDRQINQVVAAPGDHAQSFADFGFAGFDSEKIDIYLTRADGGETLRFEGVTLDRPPFLSFLQGVDWDHHDGFFFREFGGSSVAYQPRKAGAAPPGPGVYMMSSDVDQTLLVGRVRGLGGAPLEALRSRSALLYIDQSHEGNPFSETFAADLHAALSAIGVDADLVFFSNHTFNYAEKYEAWCADNALSTPINIIYSNWYADGLFFHNHGIYDSKGGIDQYIMRARQRTFSDFTRIRRFVSLNYTPRPHRVLLMLKLVRSGYVGRGFVSFGGLRNADKYKPNFFDLGGAAEIARLGFPELTPYVDALDEIGVLELDRRFQTGVEGEAIRMASTTTDQIYAHSYFSVVTESEAHSSDFMRVTEKSFKPFLSLHPALILGNYGSLEVLRGFGYRTFPRFLDERYDRQTDMATRYRMVFAELDRLMAMSDAEIMRLYRESWDALEHNAYVSADYMKYRLARGKQAIVRRLHDKLRSLTG